MTAGRAGYGADATLLDRMVQAIVNEADPEQVILFGSRARGDWRDSLNHVLARALREGKVLHERP